MGVRPSSGPAVGIDLAGTERGRTGYCCLGPDGRTATAALTTDAEILDAVRADRPSVVSVDAPLFLPRGRRSIDIPGPPHLRASDRWLLRLGIRFFPISLGPMRTLTQRGIALRAALEAEGTKVIEGYPGASQDLLGIPRKGQGTERLRAGLRSLGFRGDVEDPATTHDELDAVSAAYLGDRYLAGDFVAVGDPLEGWMILAPKRAVLERFVERGVLPRTVLAARGGRTGARRSNPRPRAPTRPSVPRGGNRPSEGRAPKRSSAPRRPRRRGAAPSRGTPRRRAPAPPRSRSRDRGAPA